MPLMKKCAKELGWSYQDLADMEEAELRAWLSIDT